MKTYYEIAKVLLWSTKQLDNLTRELTGSVVTGAWDVGAGAGASARSVVTGSWDVGAGAGACARSVVTGAWDVRSSASAGASGGVGSGGVSVLVTCKNPVDHQICAVTVLIPTRQQGSSGRNTILLESKQAKLEKEQQERSLSLTVQHAGDLGSDTLQKTRLSSARPVTEQRQKPSCKRRVQVRDPWQGRARNVRGKTISTSS